MEQNNSTDKICKNCGETMPEQAKFCPSCSQKDFDGRIRLKDMLSNMMINIIHLDSKFIRMVGHLLVPGKVSKEYFEGKIIRYPNPVQYFFIVMFFFLFTLNKQCTLALDTSIPVEVESKPGESVKVKKITGVNMFNAVDRYAELLNLRDDYNALPDSMKSEKTTAILDTLIEKRGQLNAHVLDSDSIDINLFDQTLKFGIRDFAEMSPDELVDAYKVTNWKQRLMAKQGIKAVKDFRSLVNAYLGSITWAILVFNVIMALLLWMMLYKHRSYYVEHFIFLMHYMSAILLGITLLIAIDYWIIDIPKLVTGLGILGAIIFMFFALKKFYLLDFLGAFWRLVVFIFMAGIVSMAALIAGTLLVFLLF